jgi:hypothetical protein
MAAQIIKRKRLKFVKLVSPEDPTYLEHQKKKYKTEKQSDKVYNTPPRKKYQVMAGLLESTIKEWVRRSGLLNPNSIISLQYQNERNVLWKELDFVVNQGNQLVIGEVKTSTGDDKVIKDACKQVDDSETLLKVNYKSMGKQIIWIDLNFRNTTEVLDEFKEDYLSMKFRNYTYDGNNYQYVHLSAKDVFDYGVKNNVILSPELMKPSLEEKQIRHERRVLKQKLKEIENGLDEVGSIDELEMYKSQLKELKEKKALLEIKLGVYENGWHHIRSLGNIAIKQILDSLGITKDIQLNSGDWQSSSSGFYSSDKEARYIAITNINQEPIEVNLLDAERVYLRLPIEQQHDLQHIQSISHLTRKTHPLYIRNPEREFFYTGIFLNEEDCKRESLLNFEKVIRNSEPVEIKVYPGEVVIIDSYRMLVRTPSNSCSNLSVNCTPSAWY